MKPKLIMVAVFLIVVVAITPSVFSADPKGTSYSRPNVSGGYDFYDSSGNKIGFSTKRKGGGYDYYDQYGNKTGYLKSTPKGGVYDYYDADNVRRGKVASHPYGGYRYYEKKEGLITPDQTQIRRDHEYKDPYGSGIEILSPGVIKGEE